MNIIRLSWSSYQSEENLEREANRLRSLGHSYMRPRSSGPRPGKLKTYDVIVINSQFRVDETFLSYWDREGLILTASSGFDHIDLEACEQQGVTVGRTPMCRARNVCDYVRSALGFTKRDFLSTGHPNRRDFWDRPGAYDAIDGFEGSTLGILGFGVIGENLPDYLDAFDFRTILVSDPLREEAIRSNDRVELASWRQLLAESDYLTLHADLNPSTRRIIDGFALERLPDSAVIINAARGEMVDLEALLGALDDGAIGGAILDVLPEEPPDEADPLRREGLVVTPHSAGFGPNLTEELTEEIAGSIEDYGASGEPTHPISSRSEDELDRLEPQRDAPA